MCGLSRTHSEAAILNFTPGAPLHNIQKQITKQTYLGSQLKWQRELLVALLSSGNVQKGRESEFAK